MKTKKLLNRLREFLYANRRAQLEQVDSIEVVLEKPVGKKQKLHSRIATETDPEKRELKLSVYEAQCRKGIHSLPT
jgi:hypothetical protein